MKKTLLIVGTIVTFIGFIMTGSGIAGFSTWSESYSTSGSIGLIIFLGICPLILGLFFIYKALKQEK